MSNLNGSEKNGYEELLRAIEQDETNNTDIEQEVVQQDVVIDESPQDLVPEQVAPVVTTETLEPLKRTEAQPVAEPTVDWEHKFKTLQGMFEARNGEVANKLATKDAEIEREAQARIEAERKLAEIPIDYEKIMGEDAYDELGEDSIKGVEALMEAKYRSEMDEMKSMISHLKSSVSQKSEDDVAKTEEIKSKDHDNAILSKVPDFFQLIHDDKFVRFVTETKDSLTGVPLRDLFDEADRNLNSVMVANICGLYKQAQAVKDEQSFKKEEHVVPTVSSQSPEPQNKPIYKRSDLDAITDKLLRQQITDGEYITFCDKFEEARLDGRVQ